MPSIEPPIDPARWDQMNELDRAIGRILNGEARPETIGYALLVFSFDQPGEEESGAYVSNACMQDTLACMKAFIARNEGRDLEPSKNADKSGVIRHILKLFGFRSGAQAEYGMLSTLRKSFRIWSGRRESNSQPTAWKAGYRFILKQVRAFFRFTRFTKTAPKNILRARCHREWSTNGVRVPGGNPSRLQTSANVQPALSALVIGALLAFLLGACSSPRPISNEEIIQESRKCREGGLEAQVLTLGLNGEVFRIQCFPGSPQK